VTRTHAILTLLCSPGARRSATVRLRAREPTLAQRLAHQVLPRQPLEALFLNDSHVVVHVHVHGRAHVHFVLCVGARRGVTGPAAQVRLWRPTSTRRCSCDGDSGCKLKPPKDSKDPNVCAGREARPAAGAACLPPQRDGPSGVRPLPRAAQPVSGTAGQSQPLRRRIFWAGGEAHPRAPGPSRLAGGSPLRERTLPGDPSHQ
jgi:hypothetical protein